jgi:hypothetical protein
VTNYTKATDFAAKDALLTGNPSKLVKGTEINTEFAAIQTADATSVKGPGTSTDNAVVRWDGTSGYTTQNSGVTISDANVVTASGFTGPLNGTVGATTPATGAFTTVAIAGATPISSQTGTGAVVVMATTPSITTPVLTNPSYSGATANAGSITTIDINGGTIDGTVIGGASAAAGSFTTLSASGVLNISGVAPYLDLKESGTSIALLASTDVFSGTAAEPVLYGRTGKKIHIWPENIFSDASPGAAVFSSIGLAVTGTLSSSEAATVGGSAAGVVASLTDWNTKSGLMVKTTNPAVRLGVGYLAGDNPAIQAFDSSNAARSLDINPMGGAVRMGGATAITGTLSATGALTTAGLQEVSGNLGLGVTPSAWTTTHKAIQLQGGGSVYNNGADGYINVANNFYFDGSDWRRVTAAPASSYLQSSTGHTWGYVATGTANSVCGFPSAQMTLDASGNLLVGVASAGQHTIVKTGAEATFLLNVSGTTDGALQVYRGTGDTASYAATCTRIQKNSSTDRSINAAGTVNASGADYAEYESNNGLTIAKGDIVGFKSDGTLTRTFSEAVRFAVKSTNPSYVGGDTWGSEDAVGVRPDAPVRIADKTEQVLVSEAVPAIAEVLDEDGNVTTPAVAAVEAVYETNVIEAGDTDAEWAVKQADYAQAKATFEAALEAARQLVDRVAYSGKVPCNVLNTTPGGYIIAVDDAGSIAGEFVDDPDFAQYKRAVGRVNRILPDGRCEVAVIIH